MSKFDRLFKVAKLEETTEPVPPETPPARPSPTSAEVTPARPGRPGRKKVAAVTSVPAQAESSDRAKVSGKRQHPDFVGLTTYIRKDVHRRVKIALLVEGQNRELSELVDELLEDWLARKGG